jgi:hypothetical protein
MVCASLARPPVGCVRSPVARESLSAPTPALHVVTRQGVENCTKGYRSLTHKVRQVAWFGKTAKSAPYMPRPLDFPFGQRRWPTHYATRRR